MGLTDDVVDVIALDQFEAIVHSIVDHRAVGKSKSQWVFRGRFVDCDPSEDVWLATGFPSLRPTNCRLWTNISIFPTTES
jgi:hypothetical protein